MDISKLTERERRIIQEMRDDLGKRRASQRRADGHPMVARGVTRLGPNSLLCTDDPDVED